MELAHGGRGHSSSYDRNDRYNSYSGSGGSRGGGVSRRSDYRGVYPLKPVSLDFVGLACLLSFCKMFYAVLITGLPSSASWQDLKVSFMLYFILCVLEFNLFLNLSGSYAPCWRCLFLPSVP